MKVVVFGDVHGNLVALEKLFAIEKSEVDCFVSHGDVINYGPWSNECVQFLNEHKNCQLLRGNHEDYFISNKYPGHHPIAKAFFEFCYPKFDISLLNTINKYEKDLGVGNFTIQHTITDKKIFFDTDLSDIKIKTNYIIGHSHQQFEREVNGFKIFNTGSLGQDRKYINQSCYLILDTKKKSIELKSFTYDINKIIDKMKADKYPEICLEYYLSKERI